MISNQIESAVEKYFLKISPHKTNGKVMQETIDIEKLRKLVVFELEKIECGKEVDLWWVDKELVRTFDKLYTSGIILLPLDPVERARWVALACIAIGEVEGFAYGNILLSADYMPDEELGDFEDVFGVSVVETIQEFRRKLAKEGWKSLL